MNGRRHSWLARKRSLLRQLRLSEETKVRLAAGVLWVLVGTAAVGSLLALLRPVPPPEHPQPIESPATTLSDAWEAAAFGERSVAAYLTPDNRSDGLGGLGAYMGDDSAAVADERTAEPAPRTAVVSVERAAEGHWAVTVAAGDVGSKTYWRVGVANRNGGLVVTGLPTPVAEPSVAERPEGAATSWETPPTEDPVAVAVTGWVTAYACGQGDVDRWLAPGVRLDAVIPPLCTEARIDRWAKQPDESENQVLVVAEAVLDGTSSERRVSFALRLARRDGRWEVTELLPATPLRDDAEAGR